MDRDEMERKERCKMGGRGKRGGREEEKERLGKRERGRRKMRENTLKQNSQVGKDRVDSL